MAAAHITHRYDDGSQTTFEVDVDQLFDGAVTEACDQVLRMFLEAVPDE